MENEYNYTITASTLEEFKKIEDEILKLPEDVIDIISHAEYGLSGIIKCNISNNLEGNRIIYFPKNVTQIEEFDDRIIAYTRGDNLIFIINNELMERKLIYKFVDDAKE